MQYVMYVMCYTNGWSWRQWTDPHGIKFPDGIDVGNAIGL